jgi:hypothetical protein
MAPLTNLLCISSPLLAADSVCRAAWATWRTAAPTSLGGPAAHRQEDEDEELARCVQHLRLAEVSSLRTAGCSHSRHRSIEITSPDKFPRSHETMEKTTKTSSSGGL